MQETVIGSKVQHATGIAATKQPELTYIANRLLNYIDKSVSHAYGIEMAIDRLYPEHMQPGCSDQKTSSSSCEEESEGTKQTLFRLLAIAEGRLEALSNHLQSNQEKLTNII